MIAEMQADSTPYDARLADAQAMDNDEMTDADAPIRPPNGSNAALEVAHLITGGTGSLGKVLLQRLLSGNAGRPRRSSSCHATKRNSTKFRVSISIAASQRTGHVREFSTRFELSHRRRTRLCQRLCRPSRRRRRIQRRGSQAGADVRIFPYEAVQTNIIGAENIVRAIRDLQLPVETVVGISTDKAVKPVNVMGMTKSIQERILTRANLEMPNTRFVVVRYGNVLASRGSVIPLFHEQIRTGGPVTITHPDMTRFLISLDEAVDLIFTAVQTARPGETYVPRAPSARMLDIATALVGERKIGTLVTGSRPGEKLHEILISEEEVFRTIQRGDQYVIEAILPELRLQASAPPALEGEYSSADNLLSYEGVVDLLCRRQLMIGDQPAFEGELLR